MLGHEKLRVYQQSIEFSAWVGHFIDQNALRSSVRDQLDRASTSICLNIAEGAGRSTSKDQARFYDIARGSTLECGACLDVIVARRLATNEQINEGKQLLNGIVAMLTRLIQSGNSNRLYENSTEYNP